LKKILLFSLVIFARNCLAQDSTSVRNRLTETITERYFVKRDNEHTKTGLYQALYKHNTPLASGKYFNNKRIGVWHFFDKAGILIENFNYNNDILLYEKPDDTISEQHIRYSFDDTIKRDDYVTKPIKPGGRYYGYLPYLRVFKLSDDFENTDFSFFTAVLEILVSPGGRLADFKVHIQSEDFERITTFSTELIDEEDRIFVPATINHEPVISTVYVKCRITGNGELDIY
jgi:hypothetical protein